MSNSELQSLIEKEVNLIDTKNVQDADKLNQLMDKVINQCKKSGHLVGVENDLIDNSISSKHTVNGMFTKKIDALAKINPTNNSKKKTKKAKKGIKRLQATVSNAQKAGQNWFAYPTGKKINPIKKNAVKNFLEELDEYLGAVDLPDEQISKKQIEESAK